LLLSASNFLVLRTRPVRLACVRHAASVRSEPGSNSQKLTLNGAYFLVFKDHCATLGGELLRLPPTWVPWQMLRLPHHIIGFWGVHHHIRTSTPIIFGVPSARLSPKVLQRKIKLYPSSIAFLSTKQQHYLDVT
jgi:hypothetical protein